MLFQIKKFLFLSKENKMFLAIVLPFLVCFFPPYFLILEFNQQTKAKKLMCSGCKAIVANFKDKYCCKTTSRSLIRLKYNTQQYCYNTKRRCIILIGLFNTLWSYGKWITINQFYIRPFAWWHHFTATTRILQGLLSCTN